MNLLYVTWNVDPELFSLGKLTLRWYGLLWGAGFLLGYEIIRRIFKREKLAESLSDKLFIYMFVGTIVGARIGHCLFYDWAYYSRHIVDILYVWEGGLSSHGGAIGILTAMYFYNKYELKKGYIWLFDRMVISVAICGACIRFGNLMNSEIYGVETTMPWGFIFARNGETVAKHPTQIYEMLYCLVTFAVCFWMYWKTEARHRKGLIFGVFLEGIFLTRFLLEFIKNNQEAFEENMLFNMGQLLSVPFIIWGVYLIAMSFKRVES